MICDNCGQSFLLTGSEAYMNAEVQAWRDDKRIVGTRIRQKVRYCFRCIPPAIVDKAIEKAEKGGAAKP